MKGIVKIKPGICGLNSEIIAISDEYQSVTISGTSSCPAIQKIIDTLNKEELDAYSICFSKVENNHIYEVASPLLTHVACPVVSGILKAIEVSASLALPCNVEFDISKE